MVPYVTGRNVHIDKIMVAFITKTCLYNFDPLKPYFYLVKLGFTGEQYFSYFCSKQKWESVAQNIKRRGGSNEYPQSMIWAELWKILEIFIWKFSFLVVKFSVYLNRHVFIMSVIFFRPSIYFFIPKFRQWTIPSIHLDTSIVANRKIRQKI